MKNKKTLSVVCLLLILLLAFAGCGPKETVTNNLSDNEPYEFSMSMRTMSNQYVIQSPDINQDEIFLEMCKRANVKINVKLIDHSQFAQQMSLMFASGDIPDVVQANKPYETSLNGSVEAGIFMPIGDIIEKNKDKLKNLTSIIPETAWSEMRSEHDGNIYAVPEFLSNASRRAVYIRKDLLDKYGLEIPETIDEYVNVLRVFKQNGVKYPYIGRNNWEYSDAFFSPFSTHPSTWVLNDKKELVPAFIQPGMKEALAFHRMLNEEGLIDPESLTNTSTDWTAKINAGNVGMFVHNITSFATWNNDIKHSDPNASWILIGPPKNNDKEGGLWRYPSSLRGYYINERVDQPEKILEFLDWQLSEEAQEFFAYGIEGEDYTKNNGEIQFTYPTEKQELSELSFRTTWLSMVRDGTYNKHLISYIPGGDEILNYYENIAPNDYVVTYDPGSFDELEDNPELSPSMPDLWRGYAAKIFFGQIPVDDFDKFVAEFYARGGQNIIDVATQRYNEGKVIERK